ncbi:MAG: PfkB family carbohydrate kinase [Bryobacteraceae bacterium]
MNRSYDVVIIGNYTKDTIVSAAGTRMVDGGGFNYGAHVAAMMKLRTAAVTRLAREDARVAEALEAIGVDVFPEWTSASTCLRLCYPSANVDERRIYVTTTAGAFTPEQVRGFEARAFLVNGSMRGEIGIDVLREVKPAWLAADVQAFVRVIAQGELVYAPWPEKQQYLSEIDILKTDAVEAEMLTGTAVIRDAAKMLADWGPREIVLTHRDGLLVFAGGEFYEAPFRPRQLVGRSGRGDTCIAAYVCRRLSAGPAEATAWAAAVTSVKMEAEGPIRAKLEEVRPV